MRLVDISLAFVLLGGLAQPLAAKPTLDGATSSEKAQRALALIQALDMNRLLTDREYARLTLVRIEAAQPSAKGIPNAAHALGVARLFALAGLGRTEEVIAAGLRVAAERPADPYAYGASFLAALMVDRPLDAVTIAELAGRNLADSPRLAEIRDTFGEELITWLWRKLDQGKEEGARHRLAEALLILKWAEPGDVETLDQQRSFAIDGRLKRGDVEGAKQLAAQISTPRRLLALLVARKYDSLFEGEPDRLRIVEAALGRHDRATADWLAARPNDWKALLKRAQFLRIVARDAEALALLTPRIADMTLIELEGEHAFWAVNEAAYILLALGRADEANRVMKELVDLGVDAHPELISMAINRTEILNSAGRHTEGVAAAVALAGVPETASPYGYMWMWEGAACGLALAGDPVAAAPWRAKLEAHSADNEAAHMRALMCLNDLDAAERLLIKRLEGEDAADVLLKMQDYRLGAMNTDMGRLIEERWRSLQTRAGVQAAIAKAGRIMSLPLSKTYWGDY